MSAESSIFAAYIIIVVTGVVVAYGSTLAVRLVNSGGFERALARMIVERSIRRAFLRQVTAIVVALVALGAISALSNLDLLSDTLADVLVAAVYTAGVLALVVLIGAAFRASDLTLANELDLRDTQPGIYELVRTGEQSGLASTLSPYLAYPIEERSRISNSSPSEYPDAWH